MVWSHWLDLDLSEEGNQCGTRSLNLSFSMTILHCSHRWKLLSSRNAKVPVIQVTLTTTKKNSYDCQPQRNAQKNLPTFKEELPSNDNCAVVCDYIRVLWSNSNQTRASIQTAFNDFSLKFNETLVHYLLKSKSFKYIEKWGSFICTNF
jgi:hypothetical protein